MPKKLNLFFENGEAQVVEAFKDPKNWLRHDLWVETTSIPLSQVLLTCYPI
uniref:hypothetical protein n=1 Tax=Roseivirga sp. TaxID=1964215 RepID=UPI0040475FBD